ncbi:MAG: hypothetical protein EA398_15980 [Deltaproteobacteria bacterium]|nr:MAG: hypothetical protein EA398_15980 [Deltaproteobacteria bacterium]
MLGCECKNQRRGALAFRVLREASDSIRNVSRSRREKRIQLRHQQKLVVTRRVNRARNADRHGESKPVHVKCRTVAGCAKDSQAPLQNCFGHIRSAVEQPDGQRDLFCSHPSRDHQESLKNVIGSNPLSQEVMEQRHFHEKPWVVRVAELPCCQQLERMGCRVGRRLGWMPRRHLPDELGRRAGLASGLLGSAKQRSDQSFTSLHFSLPRPHGEPVIESQCTEIIAHMSSVDRAKGDSLACQQQGQLIVRCRNGKRMA